MDVNLIKLKDRKIVNPYKCISAIHCFQIHVSKLSEYLLLFQQVKYIGQKLKQLPSNAFNHFLNN